MKGIFSEKKQILRELTPLWWELSYLNIWDFTWKEDQGDAIRQGYFHIKMVIFPMCSALISTFPYISDANFSPFGPIT